MQIYYLLDGKRAVPTDDRMAVNRLLESNTGRKVALTEVDGFVVSTIFLVINHQFLEGPPLLFETMVFRREGDKLGDGLAQLRYSTWEQAEAGHAELVAMVKAGKFAEPDA